MKERKGWEWLPVQLPAMCLVTDVVMALYLHLFNSYCTVCLAIQVMLTHDLLQTHDE